MPRPFTKIDRVAPFPEAVPERGAGWKVRDAAPRQAECDIDKRVLSVTMTPDVAGHNSRAVEIARIRWSVPDITDAISHAPAILVRCVEEARLHLLLDRAGVDLSAGLTRDPLLPGLVRAAADAGQRHACVAHCIESLWTGEEAAVRRVLRATVREFNPIRLRNQEVSWRCLDIVKTSLADDHEAWTFSATRRAVARLMQALIDAAAEEATSPPPGAGKPDPTAPEGDGEKGKGDGEPCDDGKPGDDADDKAEGTEGTDDKSDADDGDKAGEGESGDASDDDGETAEGDTSDDGMSGEGSSGMDADDDATDSEGAEGGEDDGSEGDESEGDSGGDDATGGATDGEGKMREDKSSADGTPGSPGGSGTEGDSDWSDDTEADASDLERDGEISDAHLDALTAGLKDAERVRRGRERTYVSTEARKEGVSAKVDRRVRLAQNRLERNADVDRAAKRAVAMQLRAESEAGRKEAGIAATAEWDQRRRAWGKKFDAHESLVEDGVKTLEEMAGKYGWRERAAPPEWGVATLAKAPLVRHVPRNTAPRRRFNQTGFALTAMHRYATDGKMFRVGAGGEDGGAVLIDASGSMSLSPEEIELLCVAAPAVNVATYCGQGSKGIINVIAERTRMANAQGMRSAFYGNVIDMPALKLWLAQQPHPRVWVSDGWVLGKGDAGHPALFRECARFCRANGIVRVSTVRDALALYCDIDPRSKHAAERAIKAMRRRGRKIRESR